MTEGAEVFVNKIPPGAFKRIKADVPPDAPIAMHPSLTRLVVEQPAPPTTEEAP